jgi:CRP-like cAMP-binding protein
MLDELVSVMSLRRFQAQEVVFEIGSEGDLFYFILDGAVEIRIPDQERKNDY